MGRMILVTGGARSGKSSYAEKRAAQLENQEVLYIATSEPLDDEMRERVKKHRAQRPTSWTTIEAPLNIAQSLRSQISLTDQSILLDCLTFLVSNVLLRAAGPQEDPFDEPSADPFDPEIEAQMIAEVEDLISLSQETKGEFIVVTNEIGLGLVPPYPLGRAYRDILGRANQILAAASDEVIFMVSGIPMQGK